MLCEKKDGGAGVIGGVVNGVGGVAVNGVGGEVVLLMVLVLTVL